VAKAAEGGKRYRMYDKKKIEKLIYYYAKKLQLPVIPCIEKVPQIKGWKKGSIPTDKDLLEWLKTYEKMNIGLVLGNASGIVGIDVDGEHAKDLLREWSNGDLPDTWTYKTPSGGLRFLYRAPEGKELKKVVQTLEGKHSELALLGEGQQTIVPPSVINGNPYKWLKGRNPEKQKLAEAPQWMVDQMLSKQKTVKGFAAKVEEKKSAAFELVLNQLSKNCSTFNQALIEQRNSSISEEDWHRWTRLLVTAGQAETALYFSGLSAKHDKRSGERIKKLRAETNQKSPMVRCSTFGCDKEQIEKCHGRLNRNEEDEITNSPGAFIKGMEDQPALPTHPIYQNYIKALQYTEDYSIDEKGNLIAFDKKGNPFEIANFVARPTLEVIRDDGLTQNRAFRIEGVLKGGRSLAAVDITAKDFLSMNWIMDNWGISAAIKPGQGKKDMCRDAIQNMGLSVQKHQIFTHIGWRQLENNRWVYLHAGGSIGAKNISIEIESELQRYRLPTKVRDSTKAAKASLRLLKIAPTHITIPLLALVYLSPLVEMFKMVGNEPNFVVWLHGTTGTRKTTLGQLFLSHFGKFVSKDPPASFKDTSNALERKAFSTKDTLILIDDFHPESSRYESQKIANIAQRVLRMYGDRIGRGRLKATTEFQRTYPPRGMALVTGEDVPKGQSSIARFIEVEILKDDVNLEVLSKAQRNSSYLAEAMVGYIEWLLPQMDELPVKLLGQFQEKRDLFIKNAAHGRLGESAAWLNVAYELMLSYMESISVVTKELGQRMQVEAEQVLARLITKQNGLVIEEKPEEIFVKVLGELFATEKVRLSPLEKGLQGEDSLVATFGQRIGWFDDQFYYLLPEATYNAVCGFLAKRGEQFPISERTLWKHLDSAKMIKTERAEGKVHRCIKKTISKERIKNEKKPYRPRLVHLFAHVMDK
jgi:hypothetical protein